MNVTHDADIIHQYLYGKPHLFSDSNLHINLVIKQTVQFAYRLNPESIFELIPSYKDRIISIFYKSLALC